MLTRVVIVLKSLADHSDEIQLVAFKLAVLALFLFFLAKFVIGHMRGRDH